MEFMDAVTGFMAIVLGYLFNTVVSIPKHYVLKSDFKDFENRIENKLDKINEKLDDIMKG